MPARPLPKCRPCQAIGATTCRPARAESGERGGEELRMERGIDDSRLMSRIIWRIMPILMLVYLVAVIDRSNIGFAKLQMAREMGLSEQAFGLASSLFFIGYLLFEVPSTLAIHRFGARTWLTRILLSWGAVTVAMAFVTSDKLFPVMR